MGRYDEYNRGELNAYIQIIRVLMYEAQLAKDCNSFDLFKGVIAVIEEELRDRRGPK